MKNRMLFTLLVVGTMAVVAGTLSCGATINHDVGFKSHSAWLTEPDGMDAAVSVLLGSATLEAYPVISPEYQYSEGVKGFALKTSARKTSLFRLARDAIS